MQKNYARAFYVMLSDADSDAAFARQVRAFVHFIDQRGLRAYLPKIVSHVARIEQAEGALVLSAMPIAEDVMAALRKAMARPVEQKTAPELLGGTVITWDDWRIDGSVRGRLKQLRK
ncbi:MAG: F0F1 ATP synthase subunit delta [bacterium]|nr:F0F1 ATP synthase subunit delta [bacterium]